MGTYILTSYLTCDGRLVVSGILLMMKSSNPASFPAVATFFQRSPPATFLCGYYDGYQEAPVVRRLMFPIVVATFLLGLEAVSPSAPNILKGRVGAQISNIGGSCESNG